jgi:lipopolysaccharide/colanic/teichoic acid biosynthesis glycosyltransferase
VKIIEAIKCFSELPYGDQCLLNTVLSHKTKITHPKYNCLPYLWEVSYPVLLKLRRPGFYYTQTEFSEAAISPVIVHFATFFLSPRPWTSECIPNSFHEKWKYYMNISPWESHPLLPESRKLGKIFTKIYHLLPAPLSVLITGILHAYIMPLTGILKRRKFTREVISTTNTERNLFVREKTVLNKDCTPLSKTANTVAKRFFDLFFSSLFLIVLFPFIYLIVGIAIKLSSPGPVLFLQKRMGKDGKVFFCYKFRSMRVNPDTRQATANDPRTTRIGRFLRRTNLDELPQFINVFKGEMSVVGPRPHALWTDDEYAPVIGDYMLRYTIKPGITGWAQINGCRGETRRTEDRERRVARDLWYMRNRTFGMDISIILKTIACMLRGDKNAY